MCLEYTDQLQDIRALVIAIFFHTINKGGEQYWKLNHPIDPLVAKELDTFAPQFF